MGNKLYLQFCLEQKAADRDCYGKAVKKMSMMLFVSRFRFVLTVYIYCTCCSLNRILDHGL